MPNLVQRELNYEVFTINYNPSALRAGAFADLFSVISQMFQFVNDDIVAQSNEVLLSEHNIYGLVSVLEDVIRRRAEVPPDVIYIRNDIRGSSSDDEIKSFYIFVPDRTRLAQILSIDLADATETAMLDARVQDINNVVREVATTYALAGMSWQIAHYT